MSNALSGTDISMVQEYYENFIEKKKIHVLNHSKIKIKRMISPELLQFREFNNYVENFREHINTAESENRKSDGGGHSSNSGVSLATTVSRKDNAESDTLEDSVFEDWARK